MIISIVPWLQVTLFKGVVTKQMKNIVKLLKKMVKI